MKAAVTMRAGKNVVGAHVNRVPWIDTLRGILITVLVLVHYGLNSQMAKYILSFLLPSFLVLSGYLFSDKIFESSWRIAIQHWAKKLILPYVVFSLINLLIVYIWPMMTYHISSLSNEQFTTFLFGILWGKSSTFWMPNCTPLYFLIMLFCALIVFRSCIKLPGSLQPLSIGGCAIIGWLSAIIEPEIPFIMSSPFAVEAAAKDSFRLPWCLDTAFTAVVFLYVGYKLRQRDKTFNKSAEKWLIVLFALGTAMAFMNPIPGVSLDLNQYGIYPLMLLSAICIIIPIIEFSRIKELNIKGLSFIGRNTIIFMVFDYQTRSLCHLIFKNTTITKVEEIFLAFLVRMLLLTLVAAAIVFFNRKMFMKK